MRALNTGPRPAHPSDRCVRKFAGIKVGDRVRVTQQLQFRWKCDGISPRCIAARAREATVTEIVINEQHGWNSFKLVSDTSFEHWQARADLELVTEAVE